MSAEQGEANTGVSEGAYSDSLPVDEQRDAAQRAVVTSTASMGGEDRSSAGTGMPRWRPELLRWLATLNPGRTQREYQKAVSYFFDTPGVPQVLEDLSFDLLLAYRGALAHRATAHERASRTRAGRGSRTSPAVEGDARVQIEAGKQFDGVSQADGTQTGDRGTGRLSPATVNLRLTALRQFLVHCSLVGSLPHLTPDRIRAALRRMSVERRRPYQILAEQEWADFLEAARLPLSIAPPSTDLERAQTDKESEVESRKDERNERIRLSRGPWGTPKPLRQPASSAFAEENEENEENVGSEAAEAPVLPRSRSRLTGKYTAERDYAMVSLALATGLRAIELAELDVGDLVREWQSGIEEWWLVLPDAKTKGQRGGRTLPVAQSLIEILLAYVTSTGRRWEREEDRQTPLFLAERRRARGRLSPQQIRAIVDRVETQWLALREANASSSGPRAAGETRKISPHALRHSTAIALLSGNDEVDRPPASVEHVRGWLGHFDIRTTQGYLAHLDARRHRRPYTLSLDGAHREKRQNASREPEKMSSSSLCQQPESGQGSL